ncbi:MAG: pyridoxal 5'-phosphate synthase glutaminase subunit PdxT [Acidobacteriota bacterium]
MPATNGDFSQRRVGLLALQGDYEAHARALADLGVSPRYVTHPEQLREIDSLIVPGGESTTMVKLIQAYAFEPALRQFYRSGRPIFGTCAGLILLSSDVSGSPHQLHLDAIDLSVARNAYGRQLESFETALQVPKLGQEPLPAVFIRAPRVARVGPAVDVLARFRHDCVLARQGCILVASFHPELTSDRRVHRLFLEMGSRGPARGAA